MIQLVTVRSGESRSTRRMLAGVSLIHPFRRMAVFSSIPPGQKIVSVITALLKPPYSNTAAN